MSPTGSWPVGGRSALRTEEQLNEGPAPMSFVSARLSLVTLRSLCCRLAPIARSGEHARFRSSAGAAEPRRLLPSDT